MKNKSFPHQKSIYLKHIFIFGILLMLLIGCSGGSGGGGDVLAGPDDDPNIIPLADVIADLYEVTVGYTVQLNGSNSLDLDNEPLTYEWSVASLPSNSKAKVSPNADATATFTPDEPGEYIISLVVKDETSASEPDTVTITAKPYGRINSQQDAEDILYTAYAGIGYGDSENEFLYNVMFNDLNRLGLDLIAMTINNYLLKQLCFAALSQQVFATFTYSEEDSISAQVTIIPGVDDNEDSYTPFIGTLTVDMKRKNGFATENCTYYGENSYEDEITVNISGYYKEIETDQLPLVFNFFVKTVNITVGEGLKATYTIQNDTYNVLYNPMEITYTLKYGTEDPTFDDQDAPPLNLNLLPSELMDFLPAGVASSDIFDEDNRDYNIIGGFTVWDNDIIDYPYCTTNGLHYVQTHLGSDVIISVNGSLKTPELNNDVNIITPEYNDLYPITRLSSGIWDSDSGEMTIIGDNATIDIEFFDDGSAFFETTNSTLGSWITEDWQELGPSF